MNPSLLGYARFHGIASDYTAIDPLKYIDDTFKPGFKDEPSFQHTRLECHNCLNTARATLENDIQREKLCLSKESARFLTSLIHDNQVEGLVINWDDLLPDFHLVDKAKIDPLIFPLDSESDVRLSRKPLLYSSRDIDLELSNISQEIVDTPNTLASLQANENSLMDQIKRNKLKCSKESFSFIQSVRSDVGLSVSELEDVLGSLLEDTHTQSTTPVLRPLSADCFPSSPTPMLEEMLPTPVSSASNGLELIRRHPPPCQLEYKDIIKEDQVSSASNRECRYDRMELSGDNSTHDTSKIDIESCIKTNYSAMEIHNEEQNSMLIATPEQTSSSAGKFNPSGQHGTCNNSDASVDSRTSAMTAVKVPLSKDMGISVKQTTVKIRQCFEMSSRNEPSGNGFENLSRHVASTVAKEPQKVRARPYQQHISKPCEVHKAERPGLQSWRVTLGSLSSFMETRGRGTKKQIPARNSYFSSEGSRGSEQQNSDLNTHVREQQQQNVMVVKSPRTPPIPAVQVPRYPRRHENLVLFISTGLLKTHIQVIQCLEGSSHPPQLIYRDYCNGSSKCQSRQQPKGSSSQHLQTTSIDFPDEADIILSPKTGIVLTTSQATMQLYLPGHKSTTTQPNIPQTESINSPLRESIYRLSKRYQQLYIFISHGAEQSRRPNPRVSDPQLSANKSLLDSLTSLSAFCTTLSEYSSITLLMIPPVPKSTAAWIFALAHKHLSQLPPLWPNSQSQYMIAFTPVNPKPQLGVLLGSPAESVWELFLRRMGLNPYAAQVVLAVLRRDDENIANGNGYHKSNVQRPDVGYISRFVEMPPRDRKVLFAVLLGETTLKRVGSLIERDWQCDWALNFGRRD